MANPVINIGSKFDARGFKKATTATDKLGKSVKSLAKTFGVAFSVVAIQRFASASLRAFTQDDKALKSLNQTLKNTGNAFAIPHVTEFIASMEKTTAVLDDQLRPAFQVLLTATGSVTKAQEALGTALNISAGTTKDLFTVSNALAKGFSGQTTALGKLGAGLSKASLKTGDMSELVGQLNKKFAGQAAVRVSTYAGQIDKLNVAAANAKETIGKGLVDALQILGSKQGLDGAITQMQKMAENTANVVVGIGVLIKKLQGLKDLKVFGPVFELLSANPLFELLGNLGKSETAKLNKTNNPGGSAASVAAAKNVEMLLRKKAAKALAEEVRLRGLANADAAAKIKSAKDKEAMEELKKKLDIDRINLAYAITQETNAVNKAVLEGQLAILDDDKANAKLFAKAIEDAQAAQIKALGDINKSTDITAEHLKLLGIAAGGAMDMLKALGSFTGTANPKAAYGEPMTPVVPSFTSANPKAAYGKEFPTFPDKIPDKNLSPRIPLPIMRDTFTSANPPGAYGDVFINIAGSVIDTVGISNAINEVIQNNSRMALPPTGSASRFG